MSIISNITSVAVSGAWKVGTIAALAAGAASSGYLGLQWYTAAHDRDSARTERDDVRESVAALTTSIREQNRAVDVLAEQKRLADERRAAAEQRAAANARRLDRALEQGAGVKATTCSEAMPTVNKILEAVR